MGNLHRCSAYPFVFYLDPRRRLGRRGDPAQSYDGSAVKSLREERIVRCKARSDGAFHLFVRCDGRGIGSAQPVRPVQYRRSTEPWSVTARHPQRRRNGPRIALGPVKASRRFGRMACGFSRTGRSARHDRPAWTGHVPDRGGSAARSWRGAVTPAMTQGVAVARMSSAR